MKWKKTKEDSSHGRDTGHGRGNLHQYESFKRRRSFTNLSMHCSGNLDLFLSCGTSGESKGVIGQKNEGLRHTAAARVNGPKVAKFLDR